MKKNKKPALWFSMSLADLRHCFVCGGKLVARLIPGDKKKRLVCADCLHITYTNPKSVAGLIPVLPDGRIVLLRREIEPSRGKWSFPAGYQELDESIQEAAVRETFEEICCRAKTTKLLGVYSYPNSSVINIVFVGKLLKGERPRPGIESQDVKIFKPKEIPWKDLAFETTKDALKDWMKL